MDNKAKKGQFQHERTKTRAGILAHSAANTSKMFQRPNIANSVFSHTAKQGEIEANNRTYVFVCFLERGDAPFQCSPPPAPFPKREPKPNFEYITVYK